MQNDSEPTASILTSLSELFGAHKPEWLGQRLFELYTEPSYFPTLLTDRPCMLIGGRGTGKTTVLRTLSYEGQFALNDSNPKNVPTWPYYGFYHRINTNRVTAFKGQELDETEWTRKFAHYMNLIMCIRVLRFLSWFQTTTKIATELKQAERKQIATAFGLPELDSSTDLLQTLLIALTQFEVHINNVASNKGPNLSLQGAPVDKLFEAVSQLPPFHNKRFFFLLDEYENLEDYQQRLMNTLIKHSGELYTFKVGVRELGWRIRSTLNENEQLISPADYIRIDITQELQPTQFEKFARTVCDERLARHVKEGGNEIREIRELLPRLSEEDEAQLLGIEDRNKETLRELRLIDTENILEELSPLQIYLLDYWKRSKKLSLTRIFDDFRHNRRTWDTRMSNYSHALLYTLRGKRRGIRKYYAGWDTFVYVSGGNIRYLLQLVEESLTLHVKNGSNLAEPVPPSVQTAAAHQIGRTNLTELEGLSAGGGQLTKLLLGLGRVFGVMAASPEGHTPELTQFRIIDSSEQSDNPQKFNDLINSAVMHLALVRWSGSKLEDRGDTYEWDYMIHPIFAPFFEFSYRRKRKMRITSNDLLELVTSSRQTVRRILAASDRDDLLDENLPEQLQLFETFYADPA